MLALSSSTQLAKLTPPRLTRVYPRKRLHEQLDFCRRQPVTWLTSPPGSGKTTAVAKYLQARKLPTVWYQVDEADGDIASLFYYLGLAVNQFSEGKQEPMPLLTPEYLAGGVPIFARNYFRKFYHRLPSSSVVVFDNYQEAPDGAFQDIILAAMQELPDDVNIFVISRNEPPAQFARLRTSRQMTLLGWDELKLTEEETFGVAELHGSDTLSPETIKLLHRETQGWMAGLVLLLAHTEQSLMHWQQTKSHELIFEFFAGEIFMAADKDLQKFLLQTAFLPSMSVEDAEELTGEPKAKSMLDNLTKHNYFTSRHSDEKGSYEYHPLFRSFLLNKAKQIFSTKQLRDAQRRAATVLNQSKQHEPAVSLLLRAEDWDEAGQQIIRLAPAMLTQGRSQTLQQWIEAMPADILKNTPWLKYWLASCELNRDPDTARIHFEQAYPHFQKEQDSAGLYSCWHGIVECFWYTQSNAKPLDQWLNAFEQLHVSYPEFPDTEVETRVVMSLLFLLYWRKPDHPKLNQWADRAQQLWYETKDINLRLHLGVRLAFYYGLTGTQLAQAREFCATQEELVKQKQLDTMAVIFSKAMCGFVHVFSGETHQCLENIEAALAISRQSGIHVIDPFLLGIGVHGTLLSADVEQSDAYLLKLCQTLSDRPVNLETSHYQMLLAWRALIDKDFSRAYQHGISAVEIAEQMGAVHPQLLCHIGVAQILFEQGDFEDAQFHLDKVRSKAMKANFQWLLYHADLTSAYFAVTQTQYDQARHYLKKALNTAKACGYGQPLWYRPEVMTRLYSAALEYDIETPFVQKQILHQNLAPSTDHYVPDSWPWPVKIHTLGHFALELDGQPLVSTTKSQRKPLELLKAVIALGGREVNDNTLCDYLWPDADGDSVRRSFDTNLHRLRKLIKHDKALIHKDFKLSLNPSVCWVDAWAFSRIHDDFQASLTQPDVTEAELLNYCDKAFELYRGPFLNHDTEESWAFSQREKLQKRAMNIASQLGEFYEKQGRWKDAVETYQNGLELDQLAESLYQRLIKIHQEQGLYAEALSIYERCKDVLNTHLGIQPSPVTEKYIKQIRN